MTLALVDSLIEAQSSNAAQDRALYDPSPEADSALEHAMILWQTATVEQRPHAAALIKLIRQVRKDNERELELERRATGMADPVTSVHEFVRVARPLLADLMHPFVSGKKSAERLAELHCLFERTGPRTRGSISVRHLLGVGKYTRLTEEIGDWLQAQPEAEDVVA